MLTINCLLIINICLEINAILFADVQAIVSSKDAGLEKLTTVVESGEKLNPETNAAGRDKIRSQLRTAKEVWDTLAASCADLQRKLDTKLMQWSVHREAADQLVQWLSNMETQLHAGGELKSRLEEKKKALQQAKVDRKRFKLSL